LAIDKSKGITESERFLAILCEKTFLGFWSYANLFRDQGGGKELCDLVVAFGNHVILFSDKSCQFPNTGDTKIDWARWYRRAVRDSEKQLVGAERWIRQFPDRIFMGHSCVENLPIPLPEHGEMVFHHIVVGLGASSRCKSEYRSRNGSLCLTSLIVGDAHFDRENHEVRPFLIGRVRTEGKYVHLLDDFTLPLILSELDTISDFVDYLGFKESLFNLSNVGRIEGEENLLALYLSGFVESDDWAKLVDKSEGDYCLGVEETAWELYSSSKEYKGRQELCKNSYIVWDSIIREFAHHSFAGTLIEGPRPVSENECFFRFMAKENRLGRAFLSSAIADRWSNHEEGHVDSRIIQSPTDPNLLYVFVFVPDEQLDSESEYRETRQQYLMAYTYRVAMRNLGHDLVLGIASQAGIAKSGRSYDVFGIKNGIVIPGLDSMLEEIANELEVSGNGVVHKLDSGDPPHTLIKRAEIISPRPNYHHWYRHPDIHC